MKHSARSNIDVLEREGGNGVVPRAARKREGDHRPVAPSRLVIESLRRIPRPELRRLLVPAGRIGRDPDRTPGALENQRIEGSTECKRGLRIPTFGCAAKRQARGGDIANDEKGTATRQQGRRFLVADPDCESSRILGRGLHLPPKATRAANLGSLSRSDFSAVLFQESADNVPRNRRDDNVRN
jgi:hypothetical protein